MFQNQMIQNQLKFFLCAFLLFSLLNRTDMFIIEKLKCCFFVGANDQEFALKNAFFL